MITAIASLLLLAFVIIWIRDGLRMAAEVIGYTLLVLIFLATLAITVMTFHLP